jgi:hypothetical protein
VPAKAEDGLSRILDGIRRSAVSDKPPSLEHEDVEMADPVPLVDTPPTAATVPHDEIPLKAKGTPLSMAAFVPTGQGHLSPLTVSSIVESRTPSPQLTNGVEREPSPLVNGTGVLQPPAASPSAPTPPQLSVLHSPKAPRYPSPAFTNNGVPRPAPSFFKPLPVPSQASSPSFATNAISRSFSRPSSSPQPISPASAPFKFHARAPSQEEGEILPSSSSPPPPRPRLGSQPTPAPRTSPFAASTGPPTQPRSHQLQRIPPSAPKALREAQNPNAISGSSSGPARGGAHRFGGMLPQTMPANLLDPMPRAGRRGGGKRKHWPRG